jgi:YfiH family protein
VDDASTSLCEGVRIAEMPKQQSTPSRRSPIRKRPPKTTKATNWKLRRADGLQILEAPTLARLGWLTHGFSTRTGGESRMPAAGDGKAANAPKPAGDVLNLGFTDWDTRERVLANREKFFSAIGASPTHNKTHGDGMRVVLLKQIHSDVVHVIRNRKNDDSAAPTGDALITREPGVLLVVQTADCVPILLADTKNKAIAAIHSGWRGTLARIAEKALGQMRMEFGTDPANVVAALGPAIGRCCYEVGSEVAQQFEAKFSEAREWFEGPYDKLAAGESDPNWLPWLTMRPPGHAPPPLRVNLDLIAANRAILAHAGVPERQISSAGLCTACRSDLFFSYRRERITGRLIAAIGIR